MNTLEALERELGTLDKAIDKKVAARKKVDGKARTEIVELKRERDWLVGRIGAAKKLAGMSDAERTAVLELAGSDT